MISVRMCGELSIEDGSVDTGLSIEGVIANYTCDTGFRLVGDAERVCQSNGLWSGTNPACQGMNLSTVGVTHIITAKFYILISEVNILFLCS